MNDVPDAFSNCLMFAYILLVFCRVKSIFDVTNFHRDLDTLSLWCQRNCLTLNINKCKTMPFYRSRSPLNFGYEIQNTKLVGVQDTRDIGIVFHKTLTLLFQKRIQCLVS